MSLCPVLLKGCYYIFTHFSITSTPEGEILIFILFYYKSHTAVALSKSFSTASLKLTMTLLLFFPLDSNRTEVIAQRTTCSTFSMLPDPQID